MKTGIIDVGGGLRGAFGTGVFDFLLDEGIHFPYYVGVSAGAGNIVSHLAGQRSRNLRFYTDYAQRKQYMGLGNLLRRGSYIDLDYVYSTLADEDGEDPLDYDAFAANPAALKVVVTDAETGAPVYFDKSAIHRNGYDVLKASSCLPGVCKPYMIGGKACFDGGISDPIPVKKALADGCDKVIVVLTRPADFVRAPGKDPLFAKLIRRYPAAAAALKRRHITYNESMDFVRQLEREGRACVIAPDDCCGVSTLTRDIDAIRRLYEKGFKTAEKICDFLR